MILYDHRSFGFNLLFRSHGSAMVKAIIPSLLSTGGMLGVIYGVPIDMETHSDRMISQAYVIGCIMAAFTYLLTFRANFAYNRYLEALSSVYQMHGKWLNTGITAAAYHYQSARYKKYLPPSFGEYPELQSVTFHRKQHKYMDAEQLEEFLDKVEEEQEEDNLLNNVKKEIEDISKDIRDKLIRSSSSKRRTDSSVEGASAIAIEESTDGKSSLPQLSHVISKARLDGGIDESDKRSLFLQELSHRISLLSAVALSTLRNDMEEAQSPLSLYIPGEPWPPVDPDSFSRHIRKGYGEKSKTLTVLMFLFGYTRTPKHRTLYNAARPFRVVGGVSDEEIQMLQKARGPQAKVCLCSLWLQEFFTREYMHGSTGSVAPPIVGRLYATVSDGMAAYNQARKVAYIPFPFPHAQITAIFIAVICVFLPILMISYCNNTILAAFLNFFTVLCFVGLHEVARELENPFQNVPNDIPLNNFQARFNEALQDVYTGFHPDSWWDVPESAIEAKKGL